MDSSTMGYYTPSGGYASESPRASMWHNSQQQQTLWLAQAYLPEAQVPLQGSSSRSLSSPAGSPRTPPRRKDAKLERSCSAPSPYSRKSRRRMSALPAVGSTSEPPSPSICSPHVSPMLPAVVNFKETLSELWGFLGMPRPETSAACSSPSQPLASLIPSMQPADAPCSPSTAAREADDGLPRGGDVQYGSPWKGSPAALEMGGAWRDSQIRTSPTACPKWAPPDFGNTLDSETSKAAIPAGPVPAAGVHVSAGACSSSVHVADVGKPEDIVEVEELMASIDGTEEMRMDGGLPALAQMVADYSEESLLYGDWAAEPIDYSQLAENLAAPDVVTGSSLQAVGSECDMQLDCSGVAGSDYVFSAREKSTIDVEGSQECLGWMLRGGDDCNGGVSSIRRWPAPTPPLANDALPASVEGLSPQGGDRSFAEIATNKTHPALSTIVRSAGSPPGVTSGTSPRQGSEAASRGLPQLAARQPFALSPRPQARSRAAAAIFSAHQQRQANLYSMMNAAATEAPVAAWQ